MRALNFDFPDVVAFSAGFKFEEDFTVIQWEGLPNS